MSEERKKDLLENTEIRVQEALDDLKYFMKKHGCLPVFLSLPNPSVTLSFSVSEDAIKSVAILIEERWKYAIVDEGGIVHKEGRSQKVQEQEAFNGKMDKILNTLGPTALLEVLASEGDPLVVERLSNQADQKITEINSNPELLLSDFDLSDESMDDMLGGIFGDPEDL